MNDTVPNPHTITYNFNVSSLKAGAEQGYCRICGRKRKLTINHIPPKSCGNKGRTTFTMGTKTIIMQNGFHCRTICAECNNTLLGADLDKEFKKFYDEARNALKTPEHIVSVPIEIHIDVQKILRCMLAHFLAANVCHSRLSVAEVLNEPPEQNSVYERYRHFVLGSTPVLENTDVYYWFYPYSNIMINPYFGYEMNAFTDWNRKLFGTLIKFFPIALFILNKDSSDGVPQGNVLDYKNSNSIILNTNEIMHKKYLEVPMSNDIILLDSRAVVDGNKERKNEKQSSLQ